MEPIPEISVIVPVYKAEKYMCKCMDSLLAQSFRNFEIVVVDDGSPDRSGAIAEEYAARDGRIRVLHKRNGGVSSARQAGIDHARGEYTIHADPDDWVEPHMLEDLYAKARQEDADMVICDFFEDFPDKETRSRQRPSALDHGTVVRELFQHLHGSCWNKLVRRECYSRFGIRFPLELHCGEDLYVMTALAAQDIRIAYLGQAYYHYVHGVNENSLILHAQKDLHKCLHTCFKAMLPAEIYEGYARPLFIAGEMTHAFHSREVGNREYRRIVWPNRRFIFRKPEGISLKSCFLFLSCFGLKTLLSGLYRLCKGEA